MLSLALVTAIGAYVRRGKVLLSFSATGGSEWLHAVDKEVQNGSETRGNQEAIAKGCITT